jgi:hypothetical protein
MRIRSLVLSSGVLLVCAGAALAQPKRSGIKSYEKADDDPQSAEERQMARRRAAGLGEVRVFGKTNLPPPKPFPWYAIGLGCLVLAGLAPFGWKAYVSTRQDLEDNATFGLQAGTRRAPPEDSASAKQPVADLASLSKRPASRRPGTSAAPAPAEQGGGETRVLNLNEIEKSPRDKVWDAVSAATNWVSSDWVASSAGMTAAEVADEIGALVEEGYLQETKDRNGKPVFKAAPS